MIPTRRPLPRVLLPAALLLGIVSATAAAAEPAPRAAIAVEREQRIVAVGDSIVYGLHDEQSEGGWVGRLPDLLHGAFPARTYRAINAGINGDTSGGVLRRLDRDVIAQSPDLVIVAIGTNDFDYGIPVSTFRANLRAILHRLQAATHAALLVQSFLPETRVADDVLRREAAYNAVVPQVARELHIGYQDLFNSFLALGRSAMTNLRHDSEHPTAAGYRLVAAQTAALLEGAYTDARGTLTAGATPPGQDSLLPDDSLDSAAHP